MKLKRKIAMKDKTKNTSALSIFGAATATSANGNESNSNAKITSTVTINVDVAGLISKGKSLLDDNTLNTSSGKLSSFRALGATLLKDKPELAKQFERSTSATGVYKIVNARNPDEGIKQNQEADHKYALEAVQRGIDFLEMLS